VAISDSVKRDGDRLAGAKGVNPNVPWLRKQMQMRCWTLADFAAACARTGEPVSTATISGALNGERPMPKKYASMVAAIQTNEPILPEEAIA
jgi:hypothetical protein